MANMNNTKLHVVYGDATLGLHGEGFDYIFSYGGGPESIVIDGKEWLYRTLKPTFWRATTDNDKGNRLHMRSGMWLAADMFLPCRGVKVCIDGNEELPKAPMNNRFVGNETAENVSITFTYITITVPETKVEVTYDITSDGKIVVTAHYFGNEKLPELPVFGMRFIMPTKSDGFTYEGLSGETYPDRMAGGIPGIYEVEGLPVTKYVVPQDCGVHMDTEWVKIYRSRVQSNVGRDIKVYGTKEDKPLDRFGIQISAHNEKFAFSCLPYTAEELENATHQEELPPARRTVLCVLGRVRGVGGFDSWGADVEDAYRISAAEDITFSFEISPIMND